MNIQKRNSIGFLALFVVMIGGMAMVSPTANAAFLDPDVPIINVELKVRFTEPSSLMLKEVSTPFTLRDTDLQGISMIEEVGDYEDLKASTVMAQATTVTYSSSWSFTISPTTLLGATPDGNFQTLSGVDESDLDYWTNKKDTQLRSWMQDKDVRELLTDAAQVFNNSWTWADLGGTTQYLVITMDGIIVNEMLDAMCYRDDFEVGADEEMNAGDMTDVAENTYELAGGTLGTYFGVWNSTTATDPFECVEAFVEDDTNISGLIEINNIHNAMYGYVGYHSYSAPTDIGLMGVGSSSDEGLWSIGLNADGDYEVGLIVDSTLENATNHPIDNYLIQLTSMIPLLSDAVAAVTGDDTVAYVALVSLVIFGLIGLFFYFVARDSPAKNASQIEKNKNLRKWIFIVVVSIVAVIGAVTYWLGGAALI